MRIGTMFINRVNLGRVCGGYSSTTGESRYLFLQLALLGRQKQSELSKVFHVHIISLTQIITS
jgi:hypothetical protein